MKAAFLFLAVVLLVSGAEAGKRERYLERSLEQAAEELGSNGSEIMIRNEWRRENDKPSQTDYQCVSECTAAGLQYGLCVHRCSY